MENIYLRNSSYYSDYRKRIEMDSKVQTRYTYKNYKLKSRYYINKEKLKRVLYPKHISYWKKKETKKALNFISNSMPF